VKTVKAVPAYLTPRIEQKSPVSPVWKGIVMAKKPKPVEAKLQFQNGKTAKVSGVKSIGGIKYACLKYGGKTAYVPLDMFVSQKPESRELLKKQGVGIISDADWKKTVGAVDRIVRFGKASLIDQPGWAAPYFAMKDGTILSPPDSVAPVAIFEKLPRASCVNGSLVGWQNGIGHVLVGQELLIIAVLAAFAAPLVEIAGETNNFGFELSGPPETGKTTWLMLFTSIAMKPSRIPTFNSTKAGFEKMFPEYRDQPFPVDEANLADASDKQFMFDFANRMANGTPKITAFQDDRSQYRYVYATTANQPFHDTLTNAHGYASSAALQRLMPLRIGQDHPLGVFTKLPDGFESSGALAKYLSEQMAEQYGTLMELFLQALVAFRAKDSGRLVDGIKTRISAFEDEAGVSATLRGKSRATSAFGLLYAAGDFAQAKGILPKSWNCMAACLAAYRNYQACLPDQTPLVTRLLTIAQRSATLDLRGGSIPRLSDSHLARHGAFIKAGKGGRIELLLTDAIKREFFPDWPQLKQTADFKAANLSAKDHDGQQRYVRQEKKKERFICFVMQPELVKQLDASD
jgi:Domain of unknown function (DUF927)